MFSYGVSDGTNGWVISVNAVDNVGTTDTHRKISTSACLEITNPGTATVLVGGEIASMISNGIRINITTATVQRLVTIVFFVGDDFQCHAGSVDLGTGNGHNLPFSI